MYDVVYILKSDVTPGELTYSLRSICENLNFRKVWFYCGKPAGIEPDEYVSKKQEGGTKWERARSSLLDICKNEKITKKFYLFNDDFYVLKPTKTIKPYQGGLLLDRIQTIEARHGHKPTSYTNRLRICDDQLHRAGLTTLNYALHIPLLVEREKMLEALEMFPRCPMFRSLYGNYANIGGDFHRDVKINSPDRAVNPELDFLSSSDKSFNGEVGKFLAERFPDPCKYEVTK